MSLPGLELGASAVVFYSGSPSSSAGLRPALAVQLGFSLSQLRPFVKNFFLESCFRVEPKFASRS